MVTALKAWKFCFSKQLVISKDRKFSQAWSSQEIVMFYNELQLQYTIDQQPPILQYSMYVADWLVKHGRQSLRYNSKAGWASSHRCSFSSIDYLSYIIQLWWSMILISKEARVFHMLQCMSVFVCWITWFVGGLASSTSSLNTAYLFGVCCMVVPCSHLTPCVALEEAMHLVPDHKTGIHSLRQMEGAGMCACLLLCNSFECYSVCGKHPGNWVLVHELCKFVYQYFMIQYIHTGDT